MDVSQLYPALRVFLSSTYEELHNERDLIQIVCDNLNISLFRAPEKSLSGTSSKAYLKELRASSIMILVLAERVSDFVDEEITAARECGIPILPFLKRLKKGGTYRLSPIAKKFREKYSMGFSSEFRNLIELRDKLNEGLSNIINARFNSVVGLCGWSPAVYREAKDLISDSHWRILLIENTSSLILGPRLGNPDEVRFIDTMRKKVETIHDSTSNFSLCYLFSSNATIKDWRETKIYSKKLDGKEYFKKLLNKCKNDNRIRIACIPEQLNSSMVGDYSYGISIDIGERLYTFGYDQHKIANELFDIGNSLYDKNNGTLTEFINRLRLK